MKCRSVAIEHLTTYLYRERLESIVNRSFTEKNIDGYLCTLSYVDSIRKHLNNSDIDTYFETNVVELVKRIHKNPDLDLSLQVNKMKSKLHFNVWSPLKRKSRKGVLRMLAFHIPSFMLPFYLRWVL